jgi:hypothetical protein
MVEYLQVVPTETLIECLEGFDKNYCISWDGRVDWMAEGDFSRSQVAAELHRRFADLKVERGEAVAALRNMASVFARDDWGMDKWGEGKEEKAAREQARAVLDSIAISIAKELASADQHS